MARYGTTVPKHWPVKQEISCSVSLYIYYKSLLHCGQKQIAFDIVHLLRWIHSRWKVESKNKKYSEEECEWYVDDFYRHYLKQLSSIAYTKIFEQGPSWMLLTHLHTLTAKVPFTPKQILDDVNIWVSDKIDNKPKHLNNDITTEVSDNLFATWRHGEQHGHLDFKTYCNDFLRWGTSGGALKTQFLDSKYRTKWAWALKHATNDDGSLKDTYDLYSDSLNTPQHANIALKEEPTKTREVITTPLPSYLRQSYLLYRWGKPSIPSPISSSRWIPTFEEQEPTWYGCIDGERFDQSIPMSFILDILTRLGQLDEECKNIADAEISSIKELSLKWGQHSWEYQGGLLSGWRITSLVGSLVSMCATHYIKTKTGKYDIEVGVIGDDLILYSHTNSIDKETMVTLYNEFGLKSNLSKTVSSHVGEFLRKTRSSGGSWAFPALGLKTLIYANPG